MKMFPSGIAEGAAFCNRKQERVQLSRYIENTQHTVIMAPRRYGKSSLIAQVVRDNSYKYVWVDFLSVTTKKEAEEKIRAAAKDLLLLLAPELKKVQLQTVDKVRAMSPELNLSAMGQSLTLTLSSDDTTPIDEVLKQLDEYAQKTNKKAVLVFDEFQQISELKESQAVEALIRHAVERSKAITYIFSGSNRHLLQDMFSKSNRPLYRLCTVITIDRIEAGEYMEFINKAAEIKWGVQLSDDVHNTILKLTERHSSYINVLCNELWLKEKPPADHKTVESVWASYVLRHKGIIVSDIISLALNQKKIVRELSFQPEEAPYSASFSIRLQISTASVRRALETLLLKDIVYQNEELLYSVLDPAISYYFRYLH